MGKFDDLASVAKTADKTIVPTILKRMFLLMMVGIPAVALMLYPPVFGLMGWGVWGGIAGLFATATLYYTYDEIKFLVKGV